MKTCISCNITKKLEDFRPEKNQCRECIRARSREYMANRDPSRKPTVEYSTLVSMKSRCNNSNSKAFKYYGERGIQVCERWSGKDGYQNFLQDMGPRPGPEYSIEREDNDGNYEPGNCRWATRSEQAVNKSTNHFVEHEGEKLTLSQLSRKTGLPYYSVRRRACENSDVDYITAPVVPKNIKYPWKNSSYTINEISAETGIPYYTLRKRLNDMNLSVDDAINLSENPRQHVKSKRIDYNGKLMSYKEFSEVTGVALHNVYRRIDLGWSVDEIIEKG